MKSNGLESRLPNFFIIGAQKSASTYLHRMLAAHPQVEMPSNEIRYFEDPDYRLNSPESLASMFRADPPCIRRGIKRPDYLARPEVPERIRDLVPDALILAILREPVSRLVSAYFHYVRLGFFPVVDINVGLRAILDGNAARFRRSDELVAYGRYGESLLRYLEFFEKSQIRVYLHEEVYADSGQVLVETANFLGLDPKLFRRLGRGANEGIYSLERLRWYTLRNRFMLRYDDSDKILLKPAYHPGRWIGAGITLVDHLILRIYYKNRTVSLDADLRTRLKEIYAPDLDLLRTTALVDISQWNL